MTLGLTTFHEVVQKPSLIEREELRGRPAPPDPRWVGKGQADKALAERPLGLIDFTGSPEGRDHHNLHDLAHSAVRPIAGHASYCLDTALDVERLITWYVTAQKLGHKTPRYIPSSNPGPSPTHPGDTVHHRAALDRSTIGNHHLPYLNR